MNQITRCPFCSTSFKVVADQLRISEGWVRCGQCKEVFDASTHFLPLDAALAIQAPTALAAPPAAPAVAPVAPVAPDAKPAAPTLAEVAPPSPPKASASEPPPAQQKPLALAPIEDDFPSTIPQTAPAPPDQDAAQAAKSDNNDGQKNDEKNEQRDDHQHDAAAQPGFVLAARRKAFWRKPAVRAVLGALILVSALALALQIVLHERDRIAAIDARAKPWLAQLCRPLLCDIAPRRQIADLVIDNAAFHKARGDSYQLALTIKNRAHIPLATPAVELTLTDVQDQPVLRRVLLPTDIAAPAEIAAQGEWNAALALVVTTGGARVAGYRLLAFYP